MGLEILVFFVFWFWWSGAGVRFVARASEGGGGLVPGEESVGGWQAKIGLTGRRWSAGRGKGRELALAALGSRVLGRAARGREC